jgi:signal recognition particle subunit SRP54
MADEGNAQIGAVYPARRFVGILDRLTRRGALSEADVDAAMREVRRALLEADVALDVVRSLHRQGARPRGRRRGDQVGHARPDGRQDRPRQLVEMLGSDAEPIDLNAPAPVADHDGRPAGLGQDDDHRQDRQAPHRAQKKKVLMASLDTRRPAAQEQLACSASRSASTRCRSSPASRRCRSPSRAIRRPARRLRRGHARHRRPHAYRRAADGRDGRDQGAANPHEILLVADALTGQDAVNLARPSTSAWAHRHRAHPRRRRRPRRRGAVDARRHRQADQADRHRREDGRAGGLPSRASPTASSAWATSSRWSRRRRDHRCEKARATAEKMRKGKFDLDDLREQLEADAEDGRHGGLMGMMPGVAKMKNQIAAPISTTRCSSARSRSSLDDAEGARNPDILKASRKKRIAAGSGTKVEEINKLLKMHRGRWPT